MIGSSGDDQLFVYLLFLDIEGDVSENLILGLHEIISLNQKNLQVGDLPYSFNLLAIRFERRKEEEEEKEVDIYIYI